MGGRKGAKARAADKSPDSGVTVYGYQYQSAGVPISCYTGFYENYGIPDYIFEEDSSETYDGIPRHDKIDEAVETEEQPTAPLQPKAARAARD